MAIARLGGRAQRTASFAGWPNEPDGQISRRSPSERDRRSQFVQANRRRHIGTIWAKRTQDTKQDDVTNPIARIRQGKAATRARGIMAKRTGEAAPLQGGQKCQIGQNEPRAEAAACPQPVLLPLGLIRLLALRLKILLYFSCCLREAYFCARCGCAYSQF
jgi:hypothetical protein